MNLEQLKKHWNKYIDEFESTEEMDIEKHIQMALKIGGLIQEIERLQAENKMNDGLIDQKSNLIEIMEKEIGELKERFEKAYEEGWNARVSDGGRLPVSSERD